MSESKVSRPKQVTAVEALRHCRRIADGLRDSADAYLRAMEAAPRVAVEVGGFYVTFDGSMVFVLRPRTDCKCPQCTGRVTTATLFGGGGLQIQLPVQLLGDGAGGAAAAGPDDPGQGHGGDAPREFVCVLLRGGHGLRNVRGEEPGNEYTVDAGGLAVVPNPDSGDGDDVVTHRHVAVSALSLARRLNVRIDQQQPAAIAAAGE